MPRWAVAAGATVVLAVLLGVTVVLLAHQGSSSRPGGAAATPKVDDSPVPNPTPTTEAGRYRASALTRFQAMNSVLFPLVTKAQDWQQHKASDAAMHTEIQKDLPAVEQTRDALGRMAPFSKAPNALSDYQEAVGLYLQSFRVLDVATSVTSPALRTQLSLAQQRLRLLGDRVFDQATYALQALDGGEKQVDGTVVQRQAEVPDWASIKLAAGPPLRSHQPAATALRSYRADLPTESPSTWRSAVQALQIPSGPEEARLVETGTPAAADALSNRLERASDTIWSMPDPQGQHAMSIQVQLALLVHAEAARTTEAAALVPAAARATLQQVARQLAGVGDVLWPTELPGRTTGLDPNA